MISPEALAGYLLEEALVSLLRRNGYRLLQSVTDDPDALSMGGHGLLVRGRGANHQADALGDLLMPAPFSLPVRLFVEAKNRTARVDLRDVRNAHGVIHDVNEYYSSEHAVDYVQPLRRHQYRYSLFSTSGFKTSAQAYALAQQISLVDLSGPAFKQLREAVEAATAVVHHEGAVLQLDSFPVAEVRRAIRAALAERDGVGDLPPPSTSGVLDPSFLMRWAAWFAAQLGAGSAGEGLLLGFPRAPFVLALIPDSMEAFEAYVAEYGPDLRVQIGFDDPDGVSGDWAITPAGDPSGFRLRFGLPGVLEQWLLLAQKTDIERADVNATELLSDISLFVEDRLIRLIFAPVLSPEGPASSCALSDVATTASDDSYLRRTLRAAPRTPHDVSPDAPVTIAFAREQDLRDWSVESVRALMLRLDQANWRQAEVIREAARRGGELDRDSVYELARFRPDRTLRGFTKPVRRIAGELMAEGLVSLTAPDPLAARYDHGPRASHFTVPQSVIASLRAMGPGDI